MVVAEEPQSTWKARLAASRSGADPAPSTGNATKKLQEPRQEKELGEEALKNVMLVLQKMAVKHVRANKSISETTLKKLVEDAIDWVDDDGIVGPTRGTPGSEPSSSRAGSVATSAQASQPQARNRPASRQKQSPTEPPNIAYMAFRRSQLCEGSPPRSGRGRQEAVRRALAEHPYEWEQEGGRDPQRVRSRGASARGGVLSRGGERGRMASRGRGQREEYRFGDASLPPLSDEEAGYPEGEEYAYQSPE